MTHGRRIAKHQCVAVRPTFIAHVRDEMRHDSSARGLPIAVVRSSGGSLLSSDACLVRLPAPSFPGRSQCEGTHWRCTRLPSPASLHRAAQISLPSADVCSGAPPRSVARADCESVLQMTIGSSGWLLCSTRKSSAAFSATVFALKLDYSMPGGALSSWHSPSGSSIATPPPSLNIPPSADPSEHNHVVHCGRPPRWPLASSVLQTCRTEAGLRPGLR